jgi:uncharacterized ferredoxin-like protein
MTEEPPADCPPTRALDHVADLMCLAARTAPKAKGFDNLHVAIVRGEDKSLVTARMREIAATVADTAFFARDADNCDAAALVVLIGTLIRPIKVPHCGYCGFGDCAGCVQAGGRCAFNLSDLGIALGSAAAVAAAHHADNRLMFSFGRAAVDVGLVPEGIEVAVGIPLSGTGKSPFFDR